MPVTFVSILINIQLAYISLEIEHPTINDEGLPRQYHRIKNFGSRGRGVSDKFEGKQANKTNMIVLIRQNLWFTSLISGSPLSAPHGPLYGWPGPRVLIGYDTNS
jgi:hypothetical protein